MTRSADDSTLIVAESIPGGQVLFPPGPCRSAMTMIRAEGLRKTYGDFPAVVGSDFAVEGGEIFGKIGRAHV